MHTTDTLSTYHRAMRQDKTYPNGFPQTLILGADNHQHFTWDDDERFFVRRKRYEESDEEYHLVAVVYYNQSHYVCTARFNVQGTRYSSPEEGEEPLPDMPRAPPTWWFYNDMDGSGHVVANPHGSALPTHTSKHPGRLPRPWAGRSAYTPRLWYYACSSDPSRPLDRRDFADTWADIPTHSTAVQVGHIRSSSNTFVTLSILHPIVLIIKTIPSTGRPATTLNIPTSVRGNAVLCNTLLTEVVFFRY